MFSKGYPNCVCLVSNTSLTQSSFARCERQLTCLLCVFAAKQALGYNEVVTLAWLLSKTDINVLPSNLACPPLSGAHVVYIDQLARVGVPTYSHKCGIVLVSGCIVVGITSLVFQTADQVEHH